MSPLPPGPAPAPAPLGGVGAGTSSSDLPPPSYEEFLRIAEATGGSSAADNDHRGVNRQLTAAASAIVAASGGSSLYPTLTSAQAQAQAQAGTGEGIISDVSSIGSDSCGHVRHRQSAAAALMKTSVEPNLTVGIDGRLVHGVHGGMNGIHGSCPLDASSGTNKSAKSSGAKSSSGKSKSSKSADTDMLVVRAAEPYVRPPPQPRLDNVSSSSCTGSAGGSQSQSQSQVNAQSQDKEAEAEAAGMEPSTSTFAEEEDEETTCSHHREMQRQLQQQIKASRAAAALVAVRQQGPQPGQNQTTSSSTNNKAAERQRRLSIPKAEVGASSRDTLRCLVPPSTAGAAATAVDQDRGTSNDQQERQQQRRLSLTEVRRFLDSDSEAEAEVERLTSEFKAKFEASVPPPPPISATANANATAAAAVNADGIPTTVLARRHTYTIGSTAAAAAYNGVGVSPNTTLHTSITTLDDPFGNQRRRASMSRLHQGSSPSYYEASHPRGRLSVADTRFFLLDPKSDDDDDGDDADDERDNKTEVGLDRAGRRHKHASFRRRSSSASATALAALMPSASPSFPTGSVSGASDDGSDNLPGRHALFANRRRNKCNNKKEAVPKKEAAEAPTHSAEYFAASCHDNDHQGIVADHGAAAVRTGLSKSDPGLRLPLNAIEVGLLPLNDTTDSKEPTVIHRATSLLDVRAKSGTVQAAEYDPSASGKRYPRSASIDLLRSRLSAAPSTDAADILSRVPQRTSILTVRTMEESIGQSGDVCREMGRLRRMSRLGSYHGSMESGDEVQLDAAAATKEEVGATKKRRRSSMISFNEVEVRSYPITAGDHPCVTSGPPLTLQWDAVDQQTIDLDNYESTRPQYRSREQMYMPANVRVEALRSEGHARSIIEGSAEKAKEGKKQRKQTRRRSGIIFAVEHALERFKRGLKNMVHRKKKDEEEEVLRATKAADAQSMKERDEEFAREAETIDALAETEDLRGFIVSIDANESVEAGNDDIQKGE